MLKMDKTNYITLSGVDGFWTPFENGVFGTEEHFGIIDEFSLNISEEELKHISRACGSVGLADKVVTKSTEIIADIVTPEISPVMLARAFKGKLTQNQVLAQTAVTASVAIDAYDTAYHIGHRHLSNVIVADGMNPIPAYIEGTDYSIDYKEGTITIPPSSGIMSGTTVDVTYDNAKYTAWTIAAFTQKSATGKLRLKACALEGMDIEYTFEKMTLKLSGSYSVVSAEDFATIALQATVLADTSITNTNKSQTINIKGDDLFA